MQKILGLLVVLGCVFGGYFEAGGQLVAIWQPAEMIIILGAGFGAMIIGNPKHVLKEIAHQIKGVISKKQLGPEFQRQLLMCLYELLEMVQNGGLRMLDQHIEQPEESTIFQKYPLVLTQKRLVTFIADNFRLMAMGKIDAHELEARKMNAQERQTEKYERDLNQDRRAPDHFHINGGNGLQDLDPGNFHKRKDNAQQQAEEAGHQRNQDRHFDPGHEYVIIFDGCIDNQIHFVLHLLKYPHGAGASGMSACVLPSDV